MFNRKLTPESLLEEARTKLDHALVAFASVMEAADNAVTELRTANHALSTQIGANQARIDAVDSINNKAVLHAEHVTRAIQTGSEK